MNLEFFIIMSITKGFLERLPESFKVHALQTCCWLNQERDLLFLLAWIFESEGFPILPFDDVVSCREGCWWLTVCFLFDPKPLPSCSEVSKLAFHCFFWSRHHVDQTKIIVNHDLSPYLYWNQMMAVEIQRLLMLGVLLFSRSLCLVGPFHTKVVGKSRRERSLSSVRLFAESYLTLSYY